MQPEEEVIQAAQRRAAALAAGDEAAVLTAAVTDEVTRDGRDLAFQLRLTQTWVRTAGGWRCLAGHASRPA